MRLPTKPGSRDASATPASKNESKITIFILGAVHDVYAGLNDSENCLDFTSITMESLFVKPVKEGGGVNYWVQCFTRQQKTLIKDPFQFFLTKLAQMKMSEKKEENTALQKMFFNVLFGLF